MMSADLIKWRAISRLWAFQSSCLLWGTIKRIESGGMWTTGYSQTSLCYSIMKIFTFNSSVASIVRFSEENPLASERSCNYPKLFCYVCYDKLTYFDVVLRIFVVHLFLIFYFGRWFFESFYCKDLILQVNLGLIFINNNYVQVYSFLRSEFETALESLSSKSIAGQVCQGALKPPFWSDLCLSRTGPWQKQKSHWLCLWLIASTSSL